MSNLLTDNHEGILTITINRPDKLNALNRQTIAEIGVVMQAARTDSSVRGIIITGSGNKAFIAGADIAEFSAYTREEGKKLSADGHAVFNAIEQFPRPVIAAINGFALGGGCELAMSCHLRIAATQAKFGQPEVKLGVIPGYGGTQRMVQLIGKGKAMELMMTGNMISADEALQYGLVNYVTTQEELIGRCREIMFSILAQSPQAVAGVIRSVLAGLDEKQDGFKTEIDEFGRCFGTEEFREGVSAFLEKRKPSFFQKVNSQ
jgi:enoyl-CoA hydratase